MDKKIIILFLIVCIIFVLVKKSNQVVEKMTLVEAFNRKKYLVRDLNDRNESANLLAKLMDNLKLLISNLKEKSDSTREKNYLNLNLILKLSIIKLMVFMYVKMKEVMI